MAATAWILPMADVVKIAVLRPSAVGDFVFVLPALHALKHTYPDAELVFIGKEWHAQFLRGRPGPVDRVVVLPPVQGVGAPAEMNVIRGSVNQGLMARESTERDPIDPESVEPESIKAEPIEAGAVESGALEPESIEAEPIEAEPIEAESIEPGLVKPESVEPKPIELDPVERFIARMRDEHFDIALQMFGGGHFSNPFIARFGARLTVGARAADAAPLDRTIAHVEPGSRRLALLEIAALAGAAALPLRRELDVTHADRDEAARVLPLDSTRPLVLLQPGSTDPRRCWPPERFAAVGDALALLGAAVAINGTAAEAGLVNQVRAAMRCDALDLSGKLSLGGLCGLLERASVVVSNDTGPLHLALAIGTPCVGIFWHTNLMDGMPLRPSLLRAAVSARLRCPVCGLDNRAERCAHAVSFVDSVTVEEVVEKAVSLMRAGQDGWQ